MFSLTSVGGATGKMPHYFFPSTTTRDL